MSIQQAIDTIEQEIESHHQSIADLEQALGPLRKLVGLDDPAPPAKRSPVTPSAPRPVKAATTRRTDGRTDGARSAPPVKAPRSLPDGDGLTSKIVAALEKRSPLSPRELAAIVKADPVPVRDAVKALVAGSRVHLTGVTNTRRIHFGPAPAPARVSSNPPKQTESVKRPETRPSTAATPASTAEETEGRDRIVLEQLRGGEGRAGFTVMQLRWLVPLRNDSIPAIERSLVRLKLKGLVTEDEGVWRSA